MKKSPPLGRDVTIDCAPIEAWGHDEMPPQEQTSWSGGYARSAAAARATFGPGYGNPNYDKMPARTTFDPGYGEPNPKDLIGTDDSVNPKDLIGATKTPLRLVPPTAIALVAEVMKVGADKYGPYNWRAYKVQYETYVEAAMRHLFAFADGEDCDPETGLSHLAHACAGLMILMDAKSISMAKDNRPTPGAAGAIMRSPICKLPEPQ